MTESTPRLDRERMKSSLNHHLSDQTDCREVQRCAATTAPVSRTVIMLHTRRKRPVCKAQKHGAECCMSQDTSGACSCQRFLSSAPQSGQEHLHRERSGDVAASRSGEPLMNAAVQSATDRKDGEWLRTHCSLYSIIGVVVVLSVLLFISHMTCTVRWWCF